VLLGKAVGKYVGYLVGLGLVGVRDGGRVCKGVGGRVSPLIEGEGVVGRTDGEKLGLADGIDDGVNVGAFESGRRDGLHTVSDGCLVGKTVTELGMDDERSGEEKGEVVGFTLGTPLGEHVGMLLGDTVGRDEGKLLGFTLGTPLGDSLGGHVGMVLGDTVGRDEGRMLGFTLGT
jgi:hypothetical protein